MPTMSSLRERRDRCSFPWGINETIELEYRAFAAADLTQADLQQMIERANGQPPDEQKRILAAFVADLLASWNVYEWERLADAAAAESGELEHGPMLAITVDTLAALDDRFVAACAAAIIEHVHLGKSSGLPLSGPGIATTSPTGDGTSSPVARENRASRRSAKSRKSRSSVA